MNSESLGTFAVKAKGGAGYKSKLKPALDFAYTSAPQLNCQWSYKIFGNLNYL